MKRKMQIFVAILYVGFVQAQYTAIPDVNFEQSLISQGIDSEGIIDGQVLTSDINNLELLSVSHRINNLTGIEDFIALKELFCELNNIESLDLSNNILLEKLWCNDNLLTNLNISGCINLKELKCNSNYLTSLDLSTNLRLENIICWYNNLTSLDFSSCQNLLHVNCEVNNISLLNVVNNGNLLTLAMGGNPIDNINISQNNNLRYLACGGTLIDNLDVSHNLYLEFLHFVQNQISDIDLSKNQKLKKLYCNDNLLISLDLRQQIFLEEFTCNNNNLSTLDIRNGNNQIITNFQALNNPNLDCIFVDDKAYSAENWLDIDVISTFVETELECEALSLNDFAQDVIVSLYPNPIKENLYVDLINDEIKKIVVHSILGKKIKTTEINILDFTNVKKGIYFIDILTINDKILRRKIIKM